MNKGKIKKAERLEIRILLDKKYSFREIAKTMNRSISSISVEVNKNGGKEEYDPEKADWKSRIRKWRSKHNWKKIDQNKKLRTYITNKLKLHWNPDEISGRMKKDKEPFYASKTAIYDWLRSPRGQYFCRYLYSRRYRKKKNTKKTKRVLIPNRISIELRPKGASNRTRYGHFESDSVVSGKFGGGGASILQERKSKLIDGRIMNNMKASNTSHLINEMLEDKKSFSITTDNGIEYQHHEKINVPVYFCDTYSSWQKGGIENANKMIRRYFPKGTNFSKISQNELDKVLNIINNKPRKSLGYHTATEVALKSGIISSIKS